MKKAALLLVMSGVLAIWSVGVAAGTQQQGSSNPSHVMLTPDEIKWEPFPALGPGVEWAVLSGNPDQPGSPFVFRIKQPDGSKVAPHWHPVDENVTVISGTFLYGVGEKFDRRALRELPQGSYAFMPKKTRHFAMSKGESVTQVNGIGPFKVIYVNPADDPSHQSANEVRTAAPR